MKSHCGEAEKPLYRFTIRDDAGETYLERAEIKNYKFIERNNAKIIQYRDERNHNLREVKLVALDMVVNDVIYSYDGDGSRALRIFYAIYTQRIEELKKNQLRLLEDKLVRVARLLPKPVSYKHRCYYDECETYEHGYCWAHSLPVESISEPCCEESEEDFKMLNEKKEKGE